ncbi:MAG: hypothetical protein HOA25_01225 [Gammaproteobacteria bacterium]|nr:hypothetical protein [Gammaproteobacteria bacterium]
MKISEITPNVSVSTGNPRGGIDLCFDLTAQETIQLTEVWTIAGWQIRFVFLPPHQTLELEGKNHYLKVIVGELANLERDCFAENFAVRTTRLEKQRVSSGSHGLLCALLTETPGLLPNIHDMSDCVFAGPMAQHLEWKSFKERFGASTDYFDQLDNHMANGFHLLDSEESEITYVNFWTCGKNGDVSTHNHSQAPSLAGPAFAEIHLVLNNGSGAAGMYKTNGPDSDAREVYVMKRGDEHGPFFEHRGGKPVLLGNGAVKYPWHGWQSGNDGKEIQSYDLVAAFEISPDYVLIPTSEVI